MAHLVKVAFNNEELLAVVSENKQYVSIAPICNFIGLSANRQKAKLKSDPTYEAKLLKVQTKGGGQEVFCIPLDKLNGWLFSINPNKTKPEVREKLIVYKKECFRVLYEHFNKKATVQCALPDNMSTRISGYKGQLKRKQNEIDALRMENFALRNRIKELENDPRLCEAYNAALDTMHAIDDLRGDMAELYDMLLTMIGKMDRRSIFLGALRQRVSIPLKTGLKE